MAGIGNGGFFNRTRTHTHLLLIIAMGFAVYANTLHAPFQFDDQANIVDNTAIRSFEVFRDTLKKTLMQW